MTTHTPRVSLGLPVYNGQDFLAPALESMLAQTFADFELIISDNASTDGSEEICRRFAEQDERIRYVRQSENLGAAPNFNRTCELARGEYFKWVAHDDLHAPTFLERCVDVLDGQDDVVLCMPQCRVIDDSGEWIIGETHEAMLDGGQILTDEAFQQRWELLSSERPHQRYLGVLVQSRRCYELFGLMRLEAVRRTPLLRPYPNSEKVFLAEMSLLGRWIQVEEPLFFSRWHHSRYSNQKSWTDKNQHWNPRNRSRFVWPHQPRCAWGYLRAPWLYPLSWLARLACLGAFAQFLLQVGRWRNILAGAVRGTGMTIELPAESARAGRPAQPKHHQT